jgi:hypothetical protein
MSRAQKKPANPGKYEGKVYLTYEESTDFLGISLSTLARYVVDEQIQTLKFHRDKKRYLKIEDVKLIEDLIKNPWKRTVPQEEPAKSVEAKADVSRMETKKESATEEQPWYLPEQEKSTEDKSEDAA